MSSPVLVVIPCLNEADHLDALLEILLGARGAKDQVLVIADGGSDDGSVAIGQAWAAARPNVIWMDNPGRLQSIGINRAVESYGESATYLVRIDAHAHYPPDYVHRLVLSAEATGADSVVVPMAAVGEACFQEAAATAQNSRLGTGGSAHRSVGRSGWVDHGHHALMRIERFNRLGGYDPRFSHNEDAEYDVRVHMTGGRVWLDADLALAYFPRRSPGALARQYRNYGRGRARTVRLHRLPLKPRQAAPLAIAPALLMAAASLLLAPLSAWALAGLLPMLAWAGACIAVGVGLGLRSRRACAWLSGPAAMIMHAAWSWGFWAETLLHPRLEEPRTGPLIAKA